MKLNYTELFIYLKSGVFCAWLLSLFLETGYKLTTFLICCIALISLYYTKKHDFKVINFVLQNARKIFYSALIFIILNSFSVFFIDYTERDIGYLKDFIKYSLFFFIPIIIIKSSKDIKNMMVDMLLVSGIVSVYGLYTYFVLDFSRVGEIPTLFSLLLLFLLPFCIIPYFCGYKKEKVLYFMLISLNLLALILTQTRAGWISFIVASICILFLNRKNINFKKILKFIILFILIISCGFPVIMKRVNDTINYKDNYSYERIYIWQSSYKMGMDNFFTGIGLENSRFKELYDNEYQLPDSKEKHINHPHNAFLYFFVKSGIGGLIGFILFQIEQFYYLYKNSKIANHNIKEFSLLGIWFFMVFFIGSLFDAYFYFISIQKIYWALLGFIIACIEVSKFKAYNIEQMNERKI